MTKHDRKFEILRALSNNPIITMACKKVGVSRQTLYRWMHEDPDYKKLVRESMRMGDNLLNDMAQSAAMKKIHEGHWGAIKHRLDKRDLKYQAALAEHELSQPKSRENISDELYGILDELEYDDVDNFT